MFKPTRGPQRASFKSTGISQTQMIKFLEKYKEKIDRTGEIESSYRIEMLIDFFINDYNPDKGLHFDSTKLGF